MKNSVNHVYRFCEVFKATLVFALCTIIICITVGCSATAKSQISGAQAAGAPVSNSETADSGTPDPGNLSEASPDAGNPSDAKHAAAPKPQGDVIEIREKLFVAQTNDVYYNSDDYIGKTLKLEGIFEVYAEPGSKSNVYAVIRYGPGCCGIDQNCGFEVRWPPGTTKSAYPKANDWVQAVGVLEKYEESGAQYLRLSLNSLEVLPVRGKETVAQ